MLNVKEEWVYKKRDGWCGGPCICGGGVKTAIRQWVRRTAQLQVVITYKPQSSLT